MDCISVFLIFVFEILTVSEGSEVSCGRKPSRNRRDLDYEEVPFVKNGQDATPGEWPWMVHVGASINNVPYECGGVLISNQHVLTAAHCVFKKINADIIDVHLGVHDKDNIYEHMKFPVDGFIKHRDYTPYNLTNDIAVIVLREPINFEENPHLHPICFPRADFQYRTGWVSGWGYTEEEEKASPILQEGTVEILDFANCEDSHSTNKNFFVNEGNICAIGEGAKGANSCTGDSGGPLVSNNANEEVYELIGIVSWGAKKKNVKCTRKPGVYSDVSYFMPWIRKTMKKGALYCDKELFGAYFTCYGNTHTIVGLKLNVGSPMDCQSHCKANSDCYFFHFKKSTGGCYFLSSCNDKIISEDSISGTKYGDVVVCDEKNVEASVTLTSTDEDSKPTSIIGEFQYFAERKSWTDSRRHCIRLGGYLATILTPQHNRIVARLSWDLKWVGGTDEEEEGEWKWVTGESVKDIGYSNWDQNQPDNLKSNDDGREDCMLVLRGDWHDAPCSQSFPYVCRIPGYGNEESEPTTVIGEFQYFTDAKSWTDSRRHCIRIGGYLATILNSQDSSIVEKFPLRWKWVGGNDDEVEGDWKWVTGDKVKDIGYSNWDKNQPDNLEDNDDGREDCMLIKEGAWHDAPCSKRFPFLCRVPSVANDEREPSIVIGEFQYFTDAKSWRDSRRHCISLYGHLATILTLQDNRIVYEMSKKLTWVGGTDSEEEGNWKWIVPQRSIQDTGYSNWDRNQPDNLQDNEDGGEDCMIILGGAWHDAPCSRRFPYICQIPDSSIDESEPTTIIGDFQYFREGKSWGDSKRHCLSLGGYLATILTPQDNRIIAEMSSHLKWVGGTDEEVEGTWKWVIGGTVGYAGYSNWDYGQPDNLEDNDDGQEDCMIIWGGDWHDAPCSYEHSYVCRIPGSMVNEIKPTTVIGEFQYFTEKMSWRDSKRYCLSIGGYLATIHTPQDNKIIEKMSSHLKWVGGTDEEVEDDWKWVTGEAVQDIGYSNWDNGQPDNLEDNDDGREDCMIIWGGDWHDAPCSYEFPFVCRIPDTY